jgi:TBC domain-containing protein kinase-like protein
LLECGARPQSSQVMQEFLAVFIHIVAYHDATLAHHMNDTGFIPELYAIPWSQCIRRPLLLMILGFSHALLTCFLFTRYSICGIDCSTRRQRSLCALVGSLTVLSALMLSAGVAILIQMRDVILSSQFNECIMLFSDAPDIVWICCGATASRPPCLQDLEQCLDTACRIETETPKSTTAREHSRTNADTIVGLAFALRCL